MNKTTHVAACAVLAIATPAMADDAAPAVRLSLEADPLDFSVYKGWSVFSVIQPEAFGPWAIRFGTGRAYLPKAFSENGNTGWSFGFDPVTTIGVERFFLHQRRGGLFAIAALGYESMVFTGPMGDKQTIQAASIQVGAGYRYYPSDSLGLVFTIDAGAINAFYRSHDVMLDGETYKVPVVSPIAELMVGWDFDIGKR